MSTVSSFSSSSGLSLHPPHHSSFNSSSRLIYWCIESTVGSHIFTAFSCFCILFFLPLSIFILYLGHRRWRKRRSKAAAVSNLDFFTYNILALEMIGILGACFFCSGNYSGLQQMKLAGIFFFTLITPGQMLFHTLTCVERYLAVVHPIIYLSLKQRSGIRIRNISIGCVWVVSSAWVELTALYSPDSPTILFAIALVFSVILTSYCSLSILCNLIGAGPGEVGDAKGKVDRVKRRAFQTIVVITGALLTRFGWQLLSVFVAFSAVGNPSVGCTVVICGIWSTLPSSYVMPLLFLHRAGKLPCFKHNTESGR